MSSLAEDKIYNIKYIYEMRFIDVLDWLSMMMIKNNNKTDG